MKEDSLIASSVSLSNLSKAAGRGCPLHPLAVLLLSVVVGVGAWLLLLTGARVFRSRSHVPVQLRSAVVCRSTGRCGATRARILG